MEVVLRRPAIAQLDAADLDDAMAEIDFKSGRFGIENDLPAHVASSTTDAVAISTPSLASRSASSLPGSPLCPLTQRQSIRSAEHTSELQSLMRISYAVFCLK